jgi:hypothetical protein
MKRHATDALSLVFGLIFLAIAGWWLIGRYVNIDIPNLGWIAAVALIVLGLLGVAASLRRGDRGDRGEEAPPVSALDQVSDDEPRPDDSPGADTHEVDAFSDLGTGTSRKPPNQPL